MQDQPRKFNDIVLEIDKKNLQIEIFSEPPVIDGDFVEVNDNGAGNGGNGNTGWGNNVSDYSASTEPSIPTKVAKKIIERSVNDALEHLKNLRAVNVQEPGNIILPDAMLEPEILPTKEKPIIDATFKPIDIDYRPGGKIANLEYLDIHPKEISKVVLLEPESEYLQDKSKKDNIANGNSTVLSNTAEATKITVDGAGKLGKNIGDAAQNLAKVPGNLINGISTLGNTYQDAVDITGVVASGLAGGAGSAARELIKAPGEIINEINKAASVYGDVLQGATEVIDNISIELSPAIADVSGIVVDGVSEYYNTYNSVYGKIPALELAEICLIPLGTTLDLIKGVQEAISGKVISYVKVAEDKFLTENLKNTRRKNILEIRKNVQKLLNLNFQTNYQKIYKEYKVEVEKALNIIGSLDPKLSKQMQEILNQNQSNLNQIFNFINEKYRTIDSAINLSLDRVSNSTSSIEASNYESDLVRYLESEFTSSRDFLNKCYKEVDILSLKMQSLVRFVVIVGDPIRQVSQQDKNIKTDINDTFVNITKTEALLAYYVKTFNILLNKHTLTSEENTLKESLSKKIKTINQTLKAITNQFQSIGKAPNSDFSNSSEELEKMTLRLNEIDVALKNLNNLPDVLSALGSDQKPGKFNESKKPGVGIFSKVFGSLFDQKKVKRLEMIGKCIVQLRQLYSWTELELEFETLLEKVKNAQDEKSLAAAIKEIEKKLKDFKSQQLIEIKSKQEIIIKPHTEFAKQTAKMKADSIKLLNDLDQLLKESEQVNKKQDKNDSIVNKALGYEIPDNLKGFTDTNSATLSAYKDIFKKGKDRWSSLSEDNKQKLTGFLERFKSAASECNLQFLTRETDQVEFSLPKIISQIPLLQLKIKQIQATGYTLNPELDNAKKQLLEKTEKLKLASQKIGILRKRANELYYLLNGKNLPDFGFLDPDRILFDSFNRFTLKNEIPNQTEKNPNQSNLQANAILLLKNIHLFEHDQISQKQFALSVLLTSFKENSKAAIEVVEDNIPKLISVSQLIHYFLYPRSSTDSYKLIDNKIVYSRLDNLEQQAKTDYRKTIAAGVLLGLGEETQKKDQLDQQPHIQYLALLQRYNSLIKHEFELDEQFNLEFQEIVFKQLSDHFAGTAVLSDEVVLNLLSQGFEIISNLNKNLTYGMVETPVILETKSVKIETFLENYSRLCNELGFLANTFKNAPMLLPDGNGNNKSIIIASAFAFLENPENSAEEKQQLFENLLHFVNGDSSVIKQLKAIPINRGSKKTNVFDALKSLFEIPRKLNNLKNKTNLKQELATKGNQDFEIPGYKRLSEALIPQILEYLATAEPGVLFKIFGSQTEGLRSFEGNLIEHWQQIQTPVERSFDRTLSSIYENLLSTKDYEKVLTKIYGNDIETLVKLLAETQLGLSKLLTNKDTKEQLATLFNIIILKRQIVTAADQNSNQTIELVEKYNEIITHLEITDKFKLINPEAIPKSLDDTAQLYLDEIKSEILPVRQFIRNLSFYLSLNKDFNSLPDNNLILPIYKHLKNILGLEDQNPTIKQLLETLKERSLSTDQIYQIRRLVLIDSIESIQDGENIKVTRWLDLFAAKPISMVLVGQHPLSTFLKRQNALNNPYFDKLILQLIDPTLRNSTKGKMTIEESEFSEDDLNRLRTFLELPGTMTGISTSANNLFSMGDRSGSVQGDTIQPSIDEFKVPTSAGEISFKGHGLTPEEIAKKLNDELDLGLNFVTQQNVNKKTPEIQSQRGNTELTEESQEIFDSSNDSITESTTLDENEFESNQELLFEQTQDTNSSELVNTDSAQFFDLLDSIEDQDVAKGIFDELLTRFVESNLNSQRDLKNLIDNLNLIFASTDIYGGPVNNPQTTLYNLILDLLNTHSSQLLPTTQFKLENNRKFQAMVENLNEESTFILDYCFEIIQKLVEMLSAEYLARQEIVSEKQATEIKNQPTPIVVKHNKPVEVIENIQWGEAQINQAVDKLYDGLIEKYPKYGEQIRFLKKIVTDQIEISTDSLAPIYDLFKNSNLIGFSVENFLKLIKDAELRVLTTENTNLNDRSILRTIREILTGDTKDNPTVLKSFNATFILTQLLTQKNLTQDEVNNLSAKFAKSFSSPEELRQILIISSLRNILTIKSYPKGLIEIAKNIGNIGYQPELKTSNAEINPNQEIKDRLFKTKNYTPLAANAGVISRIFRELYTEYLQPNNINAFKPDFTETTIGIPTPEEVESVIEDFSKKAHSNMPPIQNLMLVTFSAFNVLVTMQDKLPPDSIYFSIIKHYGLKPKQLEYLKRVFYSVSYKLKEVKTTGSNFDIFEFLNYKELTNVLSFLLPEFKDLDWEERYIINPNDITNYEEQNLTDLLKIKTSLTPIKNSVKKARIDYVESDFTADNKPKDGVYEIGNLLRYLMEGMPNINIPALPMTIVNDLMKILLKIASSDNKMANFLQYFTSSETKYLNAENFNRINSDFKTPMIQLLDILEQILDRHLYMELSDDNADFLVTAMSDINKINIERNATNLMISFHEYIKTNKTLPSEYLQYIRQLGLDVDFFKRLEQKLKLFTTSELNIHNYLEIFEDIFKSSVNILMAIDKGLSYPQLNFKALQVLKKSTFSNLVKLSPEEIPELNIIYNKFVKPDSEGLHRDRIYFASKEELKYLFGFFLKYKII